MRSLPLRLFVILAFSAACSTTYRVAGDSMNRIRSGDTVAAVSTPGGEPLDLRDRSLAYRLTGASGQTKETMQPSLEALNKAISEHKLKDALQIDVEPGITDKAWQRTTLGTAIGLVGGLGIGYAVSSRIQIQNQAALGTACTTCGAGTLALGMLVSAAIGGGLGALISYFAGSGVGSFRPANVSFTHEEVVDEAASQALSLPPP